MQGVIVDPSGEGGAPAVAGRLREETGTLARVFRDYRSLAENWNLLEDTVLLYDTARGEPADPALLARFFRLEPEMNAMGLSLVEEDDLSRGFLLSPEGRVTGRPEPRGQGIPWADGYAWSGILAIRKKLFPEPQALVLEGPERVLEGLASTGRLAGLPLGRLWEGPSRPALFVDRDGVLIRDTGYPSGRNVEFLERGFSLVRSAALAGAWIIVVTNQSGVARGFFDENDMEETHEEIRRAYSERGCRIDAFYACTTHPEGTRSDLKSRSVCRKPGAGLILKACRDFPIDLERSLMVGDRETDRIGLPYLPFRLFDPELPLSYIFPKGGTDR